MSQHGIVATEEKKQYIVVEISGEQFGIDIHHIDSIVRMQKITRVPKVEPQFLGIINLRGEIVPIMSIRIKMGLLPDHFSPTTRIIILRFGENGAIGIVVDAVKEVVFLGAEDIQPVVIDGQRERANFINGIGKQDEELISLLDIDCIIDKK